MGIVARFTPLDIAIYLSHVLRNAERQIILALNRAGKEFADEAKSMTYANGGFHDDTGDLRSSIGYFVLANGRVIDSYFSGNVAGREAANLALASIPKIMGYQLIGIAGMDYAAAVESKGYNVITVQATMAFINLRSYIRQAA